MTRQRQRRVADERGAAAVEFALALPIFFVLFLGITSSAVAWHHQQVLTGAAREGARYGATVAIEQCEVACEGLTWAQFVRQRAIDEAGGDLAPGDACVALVGGSGTAPQALSTAHTTETGTAPCYPDGIGDGTLRVQVSLARPHQLEWLLGSTQLVLRTTATARFEQ